MEPPLPAAAVTQIMRSSFHPEKDDNCNVNGSKPAAWNKVSDDDLYRQAGELTSLRNGEASVDRDMVSVQEAKQLHRKSGKSFRSNGNGSRRSRAAHMEGTLNVTAAADVNDLPKYNVVDKTQMGKPKTVVSGKQSEKRNGKISKSKCDLFSVKAGLSSFSTAAGGNNILGVYGSKHDIREFAKHVKEVSLKELLDGNKCPDSVHPFSSSTREQTTAMSEPDGNSLSLQIANLIKEGLNQQTNITKPSISDSLRINIQLNSQNFGLWSRMIRVAIGGKSKTLLNHLGDNPPELTDTQYENWEQDDLVVFSWLIQNIEPAIASNLTEFPTSKALWDALVTTYSSGKDKLQTFDLHVKANDLKQNGLPVEDLWIKLQGIWGDIDRRDPNPMTCPTDIATYNKLRAEQKLFQFLNALDHRFDTVKREILRSDPLPTTENAYATIRKETAHQVILGTGPSDTHNLAAGLATTNPNPSYGSGMYSKGTRRLPGTKPDPIADKTKRKCDHCGKSGHTKDQCFHLVGYPEWWETGTRKHTREESTPGIPKGSGDGGRHGLGGGGDLKHR